MVIEMTVLLRIQHLKKRRRSISLVITACLVNFVQKHKRIGNLCLLKGNGKVKIESDDDSADEAYNYYVDRSAFKEGDAIVKDDSNQRFIVGETDSLEGVYCINQGYAVFRQVDILDQNEEYAIISSNTSYGLSRYDRIARDSSQVKEQDILY